MVRLRRRFHILIDTTQPTVVRTLLSKESLQQTKPLRKMQPDWSYIRLVTELLAEAVEARSAAQPPLSARSDPTGQTSSGSLPPDDPGGRIEEPRRTGTMPTPHAAHPSASLSADDQRNPYGFDNSSATMVPGAPHSSTHAGSMQPAFSPPVFNAPGASGFSAPDTQQAGQNGHNLQFLREALSARPAAPAAHPEGQQYMDQATMSQLQSWQQYLPALLAANQHVFATPQIQQSLGGQAPAEGQPFATIPAAAGAHPEERTQQQRYTDQGMLQLQSLALQHLQMPGNEGLAFRTADQHVHAAPQMQQSLGGASAEGQPFSPVAAVAHPEDRTHQQRYTDQGMLQLHPTSLAHLHMPQALRAADQHVLAAPQQAVGGAHVAENPTPASLQLSAASFSSIASNPNDSSHLQKQNGPRIRPKRALTAYNIFFKDQRAKILAGQEEAEEMFHTAYGTKRKRRSCPHGKIGFEAMAKTIGKLWKAIEPEELAYYKKMAAADKKRFEGELVLFMKDECDDRETARAALEATVPEETKRLYFNRQL
jgi:hypothetical protein